MEDYGIISVIIPVYNVEKYLRQCLDSVLVQTYQNLEIILVEDGSTDNSGKICDEYANKDDRISVIHQKNAGLSAARNEGFNNSNGDFVYFLDSDDWIIETMLETLIRKAIEEKSDIVFFDSASFEESDKQYDIPQRYVRKHEYITGSGLKTFEQQQAYKEFHSAVPLLFLRKSFLDYVGISFYPGILYEDMIYTFEVLCKSKRVAQCKEAFYQRRYRNHSITQLKLTSKNFTSSATVYKEVSRFADEENLNNNAAVNKYIARCAYRFIDIYFKLSKRTQKEDKIYHELIDDVIAHNGFGDKALVMRCKSKLHWFAYKSLQKAAFWR